MADIELNPRGTVGLITETAEVAYKMYSGARNVWSIAPNEIKGFDISWHSLTETQVNVIRDQWSSCGVITPFTWYFKKFDEEWNVKFAKKIKVTEGNNKRFDCKIELIAISLAT